MSFNRLSLFAAAVLLWASSAAGESPEEIQKHLFAVEIRSHQQWLEGNVEALDALMADGFHFVVMNGGVETKAAVVGNRQERALQVRSLRVEPETLTLRGDVAAVISLLNIDASARGQRLAPQMRILSVYTREEGPAGWKLTARSITPILSPPAPPAAGAPDPAAVQTALARLDFMVGRWQGDAWQLRGTQRVQTHMAEVVERKLGGTVLLVEGRGTMPSAAGGEQVVHHALGVISFDPGSGRYTLRSHLASGQSGEFELTLVDGGVAWTREVPGGRIRNTARFTADEWHEVGEHSRDGVTWTQVMELKLRRQQ